jgi:hypothetical protein
VHQHDLAERTFQRDSDRVSLSWLVVFSAVSGVLLVIGVAVAGLNDVLAVLEAVAVGGAEAVSNAIAAAWAWLTGLLQSAIDRVPPPPPAPPHPGPTPIPPAPLFRFPNWRLPSLSLSLPIGLVVLVLIAALAIWGLLRYRRLDASSADDEERTSVWSWPLLWRDLRALLGRLLDGLRPRRRAGRQPGAGAAPAADEPAPASLRGIYRAVLRWSAARGRGRPAHRTPLEFEPDLGSVLPEELARDLTASYVRARYGGAPPAPAELERLRERWEDLRGS